MQRTFIETVHGLPYTYLRREHLRLHVNLPAGDKQGRKGGQHRAANYEQEHVLDCAEVCCLDGALERGRERGNRVDALAHRALHRRRKAGDPVKPDAELACQDRIRDAAVEYRRIGTYERRLRARETYARPMDEPRSCINVTRPIACETSSGELTYCAWPVTICTLRVGGGVSGIGDTTDRVLDGCSEATT